MLLWKRESKANWREGGFFMLLLRKIEIFLYGAWVWILGIQF
jgi:hypothetical protein